MSTIFIILLAVIPAAALMIFIYLTDSNEREPIGLLLGVFGLGILSAIPAVILEAIAKVIIDAMFGGLHEFIYHFITALFGVALIEEFVKFMAAFLPTWRNKNFNYKFDGIVYCLFGSMGFAAIENVLYLFTENTNVVSLGVQRGLLAIPAHAMCAVFMGYYYGNAKYLKSYGDRAGCRKNMIIGFIIAISLHGFYDFCLFTGNPIMYGIFLVFVVAADVVTIVRVVLARKGDQQMYEAPEYRQYWVGPASNPYQAYGGYQAPSYGNYSYPPRYQQGQGTAPTGMSQQQPQSTGFTAQQGAGYAAAQQGAGYAGQQQGAGYAAQQQGAGYAAQQGTGYAGQQQQGTGYASQQQQGATYNGQQQTGYAGQQQATDYIPRADQGQQTQNPVPQRSVQRMARRQLIYCPTCNTINSFYAFYCTSCGSSLHQLNNQHTQQVY